MNTLSFRIRNFLLGLTLMGAVLVACEKPTITKTENSTPALTIRTLLVDERGGGDDEEEEPIIQGVVMNAQQVGVNNAIIDLIKSDDSTLIDRDTTDSNGIYATRGPIGSYRFKITPEGISPIYTDTFSLTKNVEINIEI